MDDPRLTTPQTGSPDGAAGQGGYGPVSRRVTRDDLLAAALAYAGAGWKVIWAVEGGKRPAHIMIHGLKDGMADADRIRATMPEGLPNLAVVTGHPGPDALDVDQKPHGNGWAAFRKLKDAGLLTGAFRLVRTPSGGAHLYFAGTDQRCGSLPGQFLDLKARGGYILVPPSQVDGRRYEIIDDRPFTGAVFHWEAAVYLLAPPRPAPVRASGPRHGGSVGHLPGWLEGQAEGNRNSGLFWASCRAVEAADEDALADLADVALAAGLPADEVRRTIDSARRTVGRNGR